MFFVTAYLGEPHGSAKSARDFARALLAVHDNVHIVSPLHEHFGSVAAGHELSAPIWHRYPRQRVRGSSWRRVLTSARNALRRTSIRRAMAGQLVVVNGWASYGYWKELAVTGYRLSAIIIRESPRHFEGDDRPENLKTLLSGFAEFDRLIFVSDRLRVEWGRYPELAGKPAFYLPNCCEEEEVARVRQLDRQKLRQRLGMAQDELVLICPGTIEKRKGQDIILDAWPELFRVIPHARLILLGDGGTAWGKAVASDVDAGKYGACVSRIPAQPSALEYLYASDVLLFPSRAEAMPRTILEGMALGMPIVAASVDGVPELIENGISGWLLETDNSGCMVAALRRVVDRPKETSNFAVAAEQRYKELFSRQQQIERVGKLLSWLNAD